MSTKIRLPGLLGSHPLGYLASLGLLRKTTEWDEGAKLGFTMEDDWVATLHTDAADSVESLIQRLSAWVGDSTLDRMLSWAGDSDVRVPPEAFRSALARALADNDTVLADFLSAIAADGAVDAQKGLVKPSAFYMVSGQQSFLAGVRDILSQSREAADAVFREALVGPWNYGTRAHGLGWDPSTEKLYALRHRAPTTEKPVCVAGAVILAFWALPLFPAVARQTRAYTAGFTRARDGHYFNWFIPSNPLDLDELASFILCGPRHWTSRNRHKYRSGIAAIYRSRRAEFGQGYAVFRTAEVPH